MEIVIANTNGYTIRAIKTFLKTIQLNSSEAFDVFSLLDFPSLSFHEDLCKHSTPQAMALAKAIAIAKQLKKWVIAEETFLVVPALNGLPGEKTSSLAGPQATDKDNRKELLRLMQHLSAPIDRSAFFECCVALCSPNGEYKTASALCEGCIAEQEKGCGGHGYDPLFLKHDYNLTFAELPEQIKNQVSHRAKALEQLKEPLKKLLEEAHSSLL